MISLKTKNIKIQPQQTEEFFLYKRYSNLDKTISINHTKNLNTMTFD